MKKIKKHRKIKNHGKLKSKNSARRKKSISRSIKKSLRRYCKEHITSEVDRYLPSKGEKESVMRTYDIANSKYCGVEPEFYRLQDFKWLGLITLKFHSYALSKDDSAGEGQRNRHNFLIKFMDNLTSKFRLKDGDFNWCACEEFGFSSKGHIHVIFSFDYLRTKKREDKIPRFDFSEKGQFYQECLESVKYVSRFSLVDPKSVDFHWRIGWQHMGLVAYFCKKEFGWRNKQFYYSKYWNIHEGILTN